MSRWTHVVSSSSEESNIHLFLYKFVAYVLLLKTRTSWCWNFFRKAQHPRIALLLSALDFVVMFSFDKRVCFSLNYCSRATQYFWHTFPLFFVKHDCSYEYSAHFCVLITALYMIDKHGNLTDKHGYLKEGWKIHR